MVIRLIRRLLQQLLGGLALLFALLAISLLLFYPCRRSKRRLKSNPRLVWGADPILNFSYWSRSMREAGFISETYTSMHYSINSREAWGTIFDERWKWLSPLGRRVLAFTESLFKYDVFFMSFNGFLGTTFLWRLEPLILRVLGKKTVLLPYGSDAYVYRRINELSFAHALMIEYGDSAKRQRAIAKKVDMWVDSADVVFPGSMGPDGIGRADILAPSILHIDLDLWKPTTRSNGSNGTDGLVRLAHAPNHRGAKGTEFILDAVEQLRSEGLLVELVLFEGVTNDEVRKTLSSDVDILVEQLIGIGHGLNALEGMASGLVTVSNLQNDDLLRHFRRFSFLDECPLVSAEPESITDILRNLVTRPELREELGAAGREYVEKYHGLDSAQILFGKVIQHLSGEDVDLINLYHPRLGHFKRDVPPVQHPLIRNQIPG